MSILWGSNIQGSRRLSQWLLTQGWRNCASCDQREKVIDLIKRNSDLFSKHDFDVGCTEFVTAWINTGNHTPISKPLRRQARVHLDVMDETIDKMMEADIVESRILEWAANLVVMPKKDDQGRPATPRITIDFRKLNAVTYQDKYPIPNMNDCLQSLSNGQWLSSIDLSNSFYQVQIREEYRDKTHLLLVKVISLEMSGNGLL